MRIPTVFSEDWIPDRLVARRDKLERLREIVENPAARAAYVFGPRGLGKTLTCKILLSSYPPDSVLYVPCWRSIQNSIADALLLKGFRVRAGRIAGFLAKNFRLVVFDDWNKLYNYKKSMDFLFHLHRFNMDRSLAVIVVGPWHFKEFEREICPSDVMSRYQFEPVSFGPYMTDELTEIYRQRVSRAFDTYEEEAVKFIATQVRRLGSDVRIGLRMLRYAWLTNQSKLTYGTAWEAWRMEKQRYWRNEVLLMLEPHAAFLLWLIARLALEGESPVYSHKLLSTYRKECRELGVEPFYEERIRYYMRKLEETGYISRKVESLGRHGLQSKITLLYDEPSIIVEAGREINWKENL